MKLKIKDMAVIAMLSAILLVQKEVLSFIPNVSFTMLLIVCYTLALGKKKTYVILLLYVLLDNLVYGSFNVVFTPVMYLGWFLTPLIVNEKNYLWANILTSFLYMWVYILPSCLLYNINFVDYMIADVSYELIFVATNFVTILLLTKPIVKCLKRYLSE